MRSTKPERDIKKILAIVGLCVLAIVTILVVTYALSVPQFDPQPGQRNIGA